MGLEENNLQKDDVLKIGRYILKIVDISTHNQDGKVQVKSSKKRDSAENALRLNKNLENSNNEVSASNQRLLKSRTQHWNISSKPDLSNENEAICRICLSGSSDSDDPLVSPCGCIGTMKYVHPSCLNSWLDSNKTVVDEGFCTTIKWSVITCEL